jgi:hypothetical protein
MGRTISLGVLALSVAACASNHPPPKPIEMVPLPPPPVEPTPAPPPVNPNVISLAVGGITTLGAANVKDYSVANANIDVRLTPDAQKFIIAGKTKGRCDLVLLFRNGQEKILTFEVEPPP